MFESEPVVYDDGRCKIQKGKDRFIIKDALLHDKDYSFAGTTFITREEDLIWEVCDNRKFFERGSIEAKEVLDSIARFKGVIKAQKGPVAPLSALWGIPIA